MLDRSSHWSTRYVNDLKRKKGIDIPIFLFIMYGLFNFGLVFVGFLQLAAGLLPWHSLILFLTSGLTWFLAINLLLGCAVIIYARLKYAKDTFTLHHKYGYRLMGGGKFECVYNKDQRGNKPLSGKFREGDIIINKHVVADGCWHSSEWYISGESAYSKNMNLRNATMIEFFMAKCKGLLGDYKFTIIDESQKESTENPAFTADDVDSFSVADGKVDATTFEKIRNIFRLFGSTEDCFSLNSSNVNYLISYMVFAIIALIPALVGYVIVKMGVSENLTFIGVAIAISCFIFVLMRRLSRLM